MKTKNNSTITMLSSVVCLLPLILSIVVYNELPEQIAIHWNSAGNPDNFVPKAIAAFGMPFLFFVLNIASKARLYNDPKRADASQTMRAIFAWLIPISSIIAVPITLFISMGKNIPIAVIIPALVGAVLVIYGNYLPKSRRNYTIGIKLPWTLHNADNWNKTHRLAGYLWILGGSALIIGAFMVNVNPVIGTLLTVIMVISLIITPVCYSYFLHRKTGDTVQENNE